MTNNSKCPTCQMPIESVPANSWQPFCSQRCRLIDLGEWLRGARSIPAQEVSVAPAAAEETRH